MKRNKRQIRKAKYYNLITSISSGILVIISLSCVCSYCMIDFVLCAGGFISGFQFGKVKRRKGIADGLLCGIWLGLIVTIFGLFYVRKLVLLTMLKNLLFLCISGAIGGVFGVNTKIRRPPY